MLNKNVADFTNFDGKTNKRKIPAQSSPSILNKSFLSVQLWDSPTDQYKNTKTF